MEYKKRYMDEIIKTTLNAIGAIYVKGPKWCGKTTTCEQFAKSTLKLGNPEIYEQSKFFAKNQISYLLNGEKPRLIDEWQNISNIWNAVRNNVDNQQVPGLYLLTGSVTPTFDKTMHSGAGRILPVMMYPLSLFESGDSSGIISIEAIAKGSYKIESLISSPQKNLEEIAFLICRGGWPALFNTTKEASLIIAPALEKSIYETEAKDFSWIKRKPELAKEIIRCYAKAISTTTLDSTIIKDIQSNFNDVNERNLRNYISDFEKLFIIRKIPGWNLAIRSKSARRAAFKKDFVDPSIATAALGLTPQLLFNDPTYFGLLFESLVRRDLSVYSEYLGGSLMHFRNKYGLECDNVIIFKNGDFALVDVKLSLEEVKKGINQLKKIKANLIDKKRKLPKFMMIITALGYVSTQEEDILIVPIGCLRA